METKVAKKKKRTLSRQWKRRMLSTVLTAAACALAIGLVFFISGRTAEQPATLSLNEKANVTEICELATLRCYYHNVAEFEKQPDGWYKYGLAKYGYKKMWLEYSGIIEIGIRADEVVLHAPDKDGVVEAYMPEAVILNVTADKDTLSQPITETGWFTTISSEDEAEAFAEAQKNMRLQAESDTALFSRAKSNAMKLIEQYIVRIGNELGEAYTVKWVDKSAA